MQMHPLIQAVDALRAIGEAEKQAALEAQPGYQAPPPPKVSAAQLNTQLKMEHDAAMAEVTNKLNRAEKDLECVTMVARQMLHKVTSAASPTPSA